MRDAVCESANVPSVKNGVTRLTGDTVPRNNFEEAPSFVVQVNVADADVMLDTVTVEIIGEVVSVVPGAGTQ